MYLMSLRYPKYPMNQMYQMNPKYQMNQKCQMYHLNH